jgi:hypothetical protein
VLESIKNGKRLPEARFATVHLARVRQGSVYGGITKRPYTPPLTLRAMATKLEK